jgi:hypothetical protein
MTALEVLLAVAGMFVFVLVVAGMVLLTPRGAEQLDSAVRGTQGADLSRADVPEREPKPTPLATRRSPARRDAELRLSSRSPHDQGVAEQSPGLQA